LASPFICRVAAHYARSRGKNIPGVAINTPSVRNHRHIGGPAPIGGAAVFI